MSGFSAASIAVLSYDFTSFLRDDSDTERCTGKAIIPEPTKAKLKAFFDGFQDLTELDPLKASDEELQAVADERDERVYALLSDVCSGKPSVEDLKQLRPRILAAFTRYVLENLAPKA